jgi:hypothetical protein
MTFVPSVAHGPSEKIEPIPREGYQANYLTADGLYGRASFMTAVVRVQ